MRTTLLAAAALLGLGLGQAFACGPVHAARQATGVQSSYRTASEAAGVDANDRLAQAEQTGVNNGQYA